MSHLTKENLSPEQRRAIQMLTDTNITTLKPTTNPSLNAITKHGATVVVPKTLSTKELPHGGQWNWNQSRKRQTILNKAKTLSVCFYKLSVKMKRSAPNPGYKLWVFNITNLLEDSDSTFLWCENGREEPLISCLPSKENLPLQLQHTLSIPYNVDLPHLSVEDTFHTPYFSSDIFALFNATFPEYNAWDVPFPVSASNTHCTQGHSTDAIGNYKWH